MSASSKRPDRQAPRKKTTQPKPTLQFLIVLAGTRPLVWRRILVPPDYSFWDLHVAIQDAMGWEDRHLHEFEVAVDDDAPPARIGIPGDDELALGQARVPGWEVSIVEVFRMHGQVARYLYDFGDDWSHAVVYEGFAQAEPGLRIPACVGGSGACPPEDSGGPPGYAELLRILADPDDPEHAEMRAWAGGSLDPDAFDPAAVKFDDPRVRWRRAFGG